MEECDYNTTRCYSGFSSVNTPRGTEFVQLDFDVVKLGSGHSIASPTQSSIRADELLADLEDMETEWEGQLDSKVTTAAETPRKNNLQKYNKGSKSPKVTLQSSSACTEI